MEKEREGSRSEGLDCRIPSLFTYLLQVSNVYARCDFHDDRWQPRLQCLRTFVVRQSELGGAGKRKYLSRCGVSFR